MHGGEDVWEDTAQSLDVKSNDKKIMTKNYTMAYLNAGKQFHKQQPTKNMQKRPRMEQMHL